MEYCLLSFIIFSNPNRIRLYLRRLNAPSERFLWALLSLLLHNPINQHVIINIANKTYIKRVIIDNNTRLQVYFLQKISRLHLGTKYTLYSFLFVHE